MFFFMLLLVMLTLEQSPGIRRGEPFPATMTTGQVTIDTINADCFGQSV
jgi:hypothetical protein